MSSEESGFEVRLARSETGRIPFVAFLEPETDVKIRAKILSKIHHYSHFSPEDFTRPHVDTLEGPIKEARVDRQLRVLFSLEQDREVLLVYGGERKKSGPVSRTLIEQAQELRDRWLRHDDAVPFYLVELRKAIKAKRIRWPND
jgi:hypothetical protein